MLVAKNMTEFPEPHFSVRSNQWHCTLCSTGEEERYTDSSDPLEWNSLADNPEHAATKALLNP